MQKMVQGKIDLWKLPLKVKSILLPPTVKVDLNWQDQSSRLMETRCLSIFKNQVKLLLFGDRSNAETLHVQEKCPMLLLPILHHKFRIKWLRLPRNKVCPFLKRQHLSVTE